ncbi:DUF1003 domain-containing protein [Merismopedia glauca]|uniref:DUF1003 domain-containing protein n=1 Tax=Merismopedia glauca CCAP 1448/3 TaxID=1296344 RepID=A0A2T1C0S8_9CYAN|nr:DUF1003 domain-containing protein [Merismopedia glauca]PSB01876.1 DUF1003 domain-containing protein [Merismopedia glauca CCAP 1448/3]
MTHNANDMTSDAKQVNFKASRNRVLTAPLPDPITQNIEAITSLHTQEVRALPTHQRILEAMATFFGQSTFLYSLLFILALWIFGSFIERFLPFELPPFSWSSQGLDAAALVISTGVLVRQTRQENFAEQRAQLTLHLNLLSEQKIAKIIALLEELRTDLPDVVNRHDREAQVMQEAADPMAVLEALQENLAQQLSVTASRDQASD